MQATWQYGNIWYYGNMASPPTYSIHTPTFFGNFLFSLIPFFWLDQVTMNMLAFLSHPKSGQVPSRNNMFGEMVFDSCFQTLASEPRKTHQLIGVSLNPLWSGRDAYVLSGGKSMMACTPTMSKCRITQLGICPDLGQLFLSLSERAQHQNSSQRGWSPDAETFLRIIMWDKLHNRQYLINTINRFLFAKL